MLDLSKLCQQFASLLLGTRLVRLVAASCKNARGPRLHKHPLQPPSRPKRRNRTKPRRNRDETAWQACETDETSKLKEILLLSSYLWFRRFHTPAVRFRRGFVAVSSGFVVLGALGPQWVPVESSVRRLPHNWWRRGRLQGIPQVVVKPRRHTSTPASLLLSACIYIHIYIYIYIYIYVYIVFAE